MQCKENFAKKDETVEITEVSEITETLPVLDIPENCKVYMDGERLTFYWNQVEGADGYLCELDGADDTMYVDRPSVSVEYVKQGEIITVWLQSQGMVNEQKITSDWVDYSYTMPVLDYSEIDYYDALYLSESQLVDWATYKGYEITKQTSESGNKEYLVTIEDEINKGIWELLKRTAFAFAGGFAEGYTEDVVDGFCSVDSLLEKLDIYKEDGVDGVVNDAHDSGKWQD